MQVKLDYMLGRSQNTFQLTLFSMKSVYISRKGISSSYQSCYQNHAIKEIKCEYDPCMFVVTNTQQGLDVLLPTI